jgi:putative addiction module killer protein
MSVYRIREYLAADGVSPFRKWLSTLDTKIKARVQARLMRFEQGNFGDHKAVGNGVWEARLMFGSGYRVYYALDGQEVVLLLLGGDKQNQSKDIRKAQHHWQDYRARDER